MHFHGCIWGFHNAILMDRKFENDISIYSALAITIEERFVGLKCWVEWGFGGTVEKASGK